MSFPVTDESLPSDAGVLVMRLRQVPNLAARHQYRRYSGSAMELIRHESNYSCITLGIPPRITN